MGIPEALVIASLVTAGSAVYSAQQGGGSVDIPNAALTDKEKDAARKKVGAGSRAAILSGSPEGILTPGTTASRGKLLGNV